LELAGRPGGSFAFKAFEARQALLDRGIEKLPFAGRGRDKEEQSIHMTMISGSEAGRPAVRRPEPAVRRIEGATAKPERRRCLTRWR
jgi:hypothetical protein